MSLRSYLKRDSLVHPFLSPLREILKRKDNLAFLNTTGLTYNAFMLLFTKFQQYLPLTSPKKAGRRRLMKSIDVLGLVLHWVGRVVLKCDRVDLTKVHVRKLIDNNNHDITNNVAGHSIARRPTEEAKETFRILARHGTAPRFILAHLKRECNNWLPHARDSYYSNAKDRNEFLKGRKPNEVLTDVLSNSGYHSSIDLKGNTITNILYLPI
ncbi:hypothetical protein BC833DRAFT_563262 [Globomyces pollinis-pini]|nr:hypothetical protein BC833DRAFT_563262 [Globomyces pollinis-pini]